MASVSNDPDGRKRVTFAGLDTKRRTIRLGQCSKRDAGGVARHIEYLITAAAQRNPVPRETAEWLGEIPEVMYSKLVAAGLVNPREATADARLGPFLDGYLAKRTDLKDTTRTVYAMTVRNLKGFFGANKSLADVTEGDAGDFRRWLLVHEELAQATAGRRCGLAEDFFHDAVKRRLIVANPFTGIDRAVRNNPDRQRFVDRATIDKVIDAAPNSEWRLLICLARFAGLRTPSEPFSLKLVDVDWERERILITSPKTEHHHGKGTRWIPIFPELREPLLQTVEACPEGAVFVFHRLMERYPSRTGGWQGINLRTTFEKIIRKAGCEPWPRLWHNLRSTAQTELTERFPAHVVCAWLGNSQAVAQKHYLQVTDDHFAAALTLANEAAQNPTRAVQEGGCLDAHGESGNEKTPCFQGVSHQKVSAEGLEPSTYGLKVRCSTN
jgi:integrase